MDCQNVQSGIDRYLDNELESNRRQEFEAHLRACTDCTAKFDVNRRLRNGLKGDAMYFKASADLQRRVRRAVRQMVDVDAAPKRRVWSWIRIATPLAVAALVVLMVVPYLRGPSGEELLTQEVLASHVRSLMVDHLTDVNSSDRHTVKPWFSGKLSFSPTVEDLAAQGFPLVGGRLDYLHQRVVAALIYQRDRHFINVFIWPASNSEGAAVQKVSRHGYNFSHWVRAGMNFWVVSDLEREHLDKFVELLNRPAQTSG